MEPGLGRLERARKIKFKEECEKEYFDYIQPRLINGVKGKVVEMWKNFERLLFRMSKIDNGTHSMEDFWNMNIYSLLRYKQLLEEDMKRHNKDSDEE